MVPLAVAVLAAVALHVAAPAGAQENDASPGLSGPADGAEPKTSLSDIEDEVMCPICGTSLQLSQSPQAERERAFIQDLIGQGATKDEVKDALVAEYGPEVLATPDTEGRGSCRRRRFCSRRSRSSSVSGGGGGTELRRVRRVPPSIPPTASGSTRT